MFEIAVASMLSCLFRPRPRLRLGRKRGAASGADLQTCALGSKDLSISHVHLHSEDHYSCNTGGRAFKGPMKTENNCCSDHAAGCVHQCPALTVLAGVNAHTIRVQGTLTPRGRLKEPHPIQGTELSQVHIGKAINLPNMLLHLEPKSMLLLPTCKEITAS